MPHSTLRATVERYHDGTKHHFDRFARSLGYLDWASQPHPFRAFTGAAVFPLYPAPGADAADYVPAAVDYGQLFDPPAITAPLTAAAIGDVLRHALGLSAWKQFGTSRWALRVNPSSGNLHPTEAYVITRGMRGLADTPAVYHYAADRHALELRCAIDERAWMSACDGRADTLLVALTSVHWREAWKYGERAFRYCQHDVGHAIAAVAFGAALAGWNALLLPAWSHESIASLTGVDRDEDFVEAEPEEPACVVALAPPGASAAIDPLKVVEAVRHGRWFGRANQLSEDHVQWTFIDEVARATRLDATEDGAVRFHRERYRRAALDSERNDAARKLDGRAIILRRRSALAFDGHSTLQRSDFFRMLSRVIPDPGSRAPLLWWMPRIHLLLFVHRVSDLAPGLYLLARDPGALDRLRAACRRDFLWEQAHDALPFLCLGRGDCRRLAARLSCDQDIAADGFFSLGMIAEFDASLDAYGAPFYRNLFWESGVIGQALYLAAEAAGARATGIGCFYDDPVHDVLSLEGHAFQTLYHFSVGMPVEDRRLTTESGYPWEARYFG